LRNNSGSFDGALVVLIIGLVWTGVRSWTNCNDDRPD
jgi:hypothetical protein